MKRFVVYCGLFLAWATWAKGPEEVGLPATGAPEWQLFERHPDTGTFSGVMPGKEVWDRLYVRWDYGLQQYVWVTGNDRRMILSGSKIHGARLGLPGRRGKNWFRLTGTYHENWVQVSDWEWPESWRWDPRYGKIKTERYTEGWEKIGQPDPRPEPAPPSKPVSPPTVKPAPEPPPDPIPYPPQPEPPRPGPQPKPEPEPGPQPKPEPPRPPTLEYPSCTVTATPSRLPVGEVTVLSMTTEGEVTEATLDEAAVDFPSVKRLKRMTKEGHYSVKGTVRGPSGFGSCYVEIEVTAANESE